MIFGKESEKGGGEEERKKGGREEERRRGRNLPSLEPKVVEEVVGWFPVIENFITIKRNIVKGRKNRSKEEQEGNTIERKGS